MITPTQTDILLIHELLEGSISKNKIPDTKIKEVKKLVGDASTRRYYRAELNKNVYVVCLTKILEDSSQTNSDFINLHKVLDENEIRTPKIYDYDLSKGYMLEEDLGNTTLLRHLASLSGPEDEFEIYKQVIDMLINLQRIDRNKYVDSVFTKREFDLEKFDFEFNFTNKFFIKSYLGHDGQIHEIIDGFSKVHKRILSLTKVFTHRDFHSRNLMVKDSKLICIDFQDARLGLPLYDLVSVLEDCYYQIDFNNKEKLIEYYFQNSSHLDLGSQNEFKLNYNYAAIQRVYKALGTFAYINEVRGDSRYLKYIGFAFEKLRMLLNESDELQAMKNSLLDIYYNA